MASERTPGRASGRRGTPRGRGTRDAIRRGPDPDEALSTGAWREAPEHLAGGMQDDVVADCGWGRVVFGQTFKDHEQLLAVMREEEIGRRDICLYPRDPHVLAALAPQELFIDPSHTFRLRFHQHRGGRRRRDVIVRRVRSRADADEMGRILVTCGMVAGPTATVWDNQRTRLFTYLVAEDADTGLIIGTVTGIDHVQAFGDLEGGTSLWSLAVDPLSSRAGVGSSLVRALADGYQAKGRSYLDLSVMWDNESAIALYERLGFERVPVYAVKRKNPINEPLFAAPAVDELESLNPYARIIADEALRRGIAVEVVDAPGGYLRLRHGGRSVVTRESLSELTSAVAMSRADDKRVTRRLLADAGLNVPAGVSAAFDETDEKFLAEHGTVVVKPARGEQGKGVTVGVTTAEQLRSAIDHARAFCPDVLLEEFVEGLDLRVIVIDGHVVAAAERRPARVVGDGATPIRELVRAQSRRRQAATDGESRIPFDEQTCATIAAAGWEPDDVLQAGESLAVRRTANLHTGGSIHDVTARLHPELAAVSVAAAEVLEMPVAGLDLLVPAVDEPACTVIEVNERPGLANHEPQPTAQRFIDLLFPGTRAVPGTWEPSPAPARTDHAAGD
ncbi:MAG TPA: N-acetylglutaminylglutamine synthetase [Nitriliruptorales bacterium]